jgi:hypothetical protein
MTVPTKSALICDIVKDVKDIQCDLKLSAHDRERPVGDG